MIGPRTLMALGIVAAAGLGGCVNQQEYDSLYKTNRALEGRNVSLQQELKAEQQAGALLRDRVSATDLAVSDAKDRNADLQRQILGLRESYRNLESRLNTIAVTPLDPETDQALRTLAAANADIMRYDAEKGMVRLTSDLTFALGSTEVTSAAQTALGRVAEILNSQTAIKYDAMIVGHTDDVPISRAGTRRLHPTNLYLSVHRAIAVRDVLASAGVAPDRLEVAGWGPYRPVVANPAHGGAAANRRVEIFLVPSTVGETSVAAPAPDSKTKAKEANAEEPLK